MLFWKKERQVQRDVQEYLQAADQCVEGFRQAAEAYLAEGITQRFEQLVEQVHSLEHVADQERRQIEASMYDKALIPESRGDVLGMLEALDLVPNQCSSVLYQIWTQNISMPEQFRDRFLRLVAPNVEAWGLLSEAMRELFGDARRIRQLAPAVAAKEAEGDQLERGLIREIFASDIDKADKIILKELALRIGDISDRAEDAADRLVIVAAKRQS